MPSRANDSCCNFTVANNWSYSNTNRAGDINHVVKPFKKIHHNEFYYSDACHVTASTHAGIAKRQPDLYRAKHNAHCIVKPSRVHDSVTGDVPRNAGTSSQLDYSRAEHPYVHSERYGAAKAALNSQIGLKTQFGTPKSFT